MTVVLSKNVGPTVRQTTEDHVGISIQPVKLGTLGDHGPYGHLTRVEPFHKAQFKINIPPCDIAFSAAVQAKRLLLKTPVYGLF